MDLKQMMVLYGQKSQNVLEKTTAEAFAADVKKAVGRAQQLADGIVNTLTVNVRIDAKGERTESTPDLGLAKEKLLELARQVQPVSDHWHPFIEEAAKQIGAADVLKALPRQMVGDTAKLQAQLDAQVEEITQLHAQLDEAANPDELAAVKKERDELAAEVLALKNASASSSTDPAAAPTPPSPPLK